MDYNKIKSIMRNGLWYLKYWDYDIYQNQQVLQIFFTTNIIPLNIIVRQFAALSFQKSCKVH